MCTNFLKSTNKVFLLLLLLLSSLGLRAQTVPPNCEDDESVLTSPLTRLDTLPTVFTCLPLNFANPEAVIVYTNYAKVTLKFATNVASTATQVLYREVQSGGSISPVNTPVNARPGQTVHLNLPLGKDYELVTTNTCGQTVKLHNFSTKTTFPDVVTTSEKVFNAVMSWNKNPGGQDLYALISGLSGVSIQEKVSFLQQFLKTKPLLSSYDGVFPPRSGFIPNEVPDRVVECECRTMKMAATRDVNPADLISGTIIPPIAGSDEHTFPGNPSRGRIKWDFSYAGPARWQNLHGETSRCRNNSEGRSWGATTPTAGTNTQTLPFRASLYFGQACYDANWYPKECACIQEIDIAWQYDSKIQANAETKTGRVCLNMPGRNAFAAVDDVCMTSIVRRNASGADILKFVDFDRATVVRECSRDFQETRLVDLLELGFNILAYTQEVDINTGYPSGDQTLDELWDLYYKNKIKSNLESLLTNPWVIKTGSCGVDEDAANMNKSRVEVLNGIDQFEVILSAATYMEVEGITHWKATARLISGFRLTGVLKQKSTTTQNTYCCTRSYGAYIAKSMFSPGDGGDLTAKYVEGAGIRFKITDSNFFGILPYNSGTGRFTLPGEIGEVHGQQIPSCNTTINDREETTISTDAHSGSFIMLRGRDIWFINSAEKSNIQYRIFDTQGRMIKQGIGDGQEILLHQFSDFTATSGIHLVSIGNNQRQQTYKIFIP